MARPRSGALGEPDGTGGDEEGRSWMLAFQGGDAAAFDRIVLRYRGEVRRFIGRYVADSGRAEDLEQEVFLRVYRARGRYRPSAGFRTWLFTIAVRLCLNDLRSRRRERRRIVPMPISSAEFDGDEGGLESMADGDLESPQEAAERRELEEAISAAIADLPPAQRSAILLLRFEDLSYREIGEVLGISVMAVKSLVNRGREKLRLSLRRFLRGGIDGR